MNTDSILLDLILELRARDINQRQQIEALKKQIEEAPKLPVKGDTIEEIKCPNF
jgi:hypothetical protein